MGLVSLLPGSQGDGFNGYITAGKLDGSTLGSRATAEGQYNTASGIASHAEGHRCIAIDRYAHAEGASTFACGTGSHSEGADSWVVGAAAILKVKSVDSSTSTIVFDNTFANYNTAFSYITVGSELYLQNLYYTNSHSIVGVTGIDPDNYSVTYENLNGNITSDHFKPGYCYTGNPLTVTGSHVEGSHNVVTGGGSHAEGWGNIVQGSSSHAEGWGNTVAGSNAHAEGISNTVIRDRSHAEGSSNLIVGDKNHIEGSGNFIVHPNTLLKVKSVDASTSTITFDSNWNSSSFQSTLSFITPGSKVYIMNSAYSNYDILTVTSVDTTAGTIRVPDDLSKYRYYTSLYCWNGNASNSVAGSHISGQVNICMKNESTVSGYKNVCNGSQSAVSGFENVLSGDKSVVGGYKNNCTASHSVVFGTNNVCTADTSLVSGSDNVCSIGSNLLAGNHLLAARHGGAAVGAFNSVKSGDDVFTVGMGNQESTRTNGFRVTWVTCYANGTFTTGGADYAEMFEWLDGNPENEDRRGLFVGLDGEKIYPADDTADFILGIVSGKPSVCGDVYDDQWKGMYLEDIYGKPVMEEVEVPAVVEKIPSEDDPSVMVDTIIESAYTQRQPKLNPEYNLGERYIARSDRPEWNAVGMMGKLIVRDDGSCIVNGWVKPSAGGIGTKSDTPTKFRVMKRIDDTHIKVLIL